MARNPERHILKAQYNFPDDGSTMASWIKLANNIVLPDNAIITDIRFAVPRAFTTLAGSPTITFAFGPAAGTAGTSNMFVGSNAYTVFSEGAVVQAPNRTKVSDASGWSIFCIMGSANINSGTSDIFVEYYLGIPE